MKIATALMFAALAFAADDNAPPAQTATVYVYRIKVRLMARALRPLIYFDGTELQQPCASGPVPTTAPTSAISTTPICAIRLASGEYLSRQLPPGKHMISADLTTEVGQLFDVEPGKEYFFKLDHKNVFISGWAGREPMTLAPVSMEQARREMEGLKRK